MIGGQGFVIHAVDNSLLDAGAAGSADRYIANSTVVRDRIRATYGIEAEVLPLSMEYGLAQVVYSPLAQGVLSGKYSGGEIPEGTRAV